MWSCGAIMIAATSAMMPIPTTFDGRSCSVRCGSAAPRLAPTSRNPSFSPCQIVGSERARLTMPPAARREMGEGAAAAGMSAATIFGGFAIGLVYKTAMVAGKLWKDVPEKIFGKPLEAGSVSAEISPELLGVGYIIGPKIASIMCAGGVLAYLLLIPLIKFFGDAIPGALAPGTIPISKMGPNEIRGAYVLYIGAGAVAAGGIVSLGRSLPTIWHGLREGLKDFRGSQGG